jgi:hypothetical protein
LEYFDDKDRIFLNIPMPHKNDMENIFHMDESQKMVEILG